MCAKKSASLTLTTAIHSLGSFLAGLCAVLNGSFSSQFGLTLSSTGDDFAPQFGLIFWVRTILSSICAFSVSILDLGCMVDNPFSSFSDVHFLNPQALILHT